MTATHSRHIAYRTSQDKLSGYRHTGYPGKRPIRHEWGRYECREVHHERPETRPVALAYEKIDLLRRVNTPAVW